MAFVDHNLNAAERGKIVDGLVVSQTAAMTLQVATGSVVDYRLGVTYTLASVQSIALASDPTTQKRVFMGIIDNGTTTDLWVDEYVDDGSKVRAQPPSGYQLVLPLAWFVIAPAETDLDNATINVRAWV